MFDLADYYSINSVMLDEHFRSLPPVINYSNHEFYNNRIRVMKKDSKDDVVLELEEVKELVKSAMELGQPLKVPLELDINIGSSWKEGE